MEALKKIFYHPNFNVVAGLFGIGGVLFGVFTYYESIKEPDLTYYISSTRTPIVQKGNPFLKDLSVTYQGIAITGDLSSAEIQIWNRGKAPILGGDISNGGNIEKTIVLKTPNGEPIYSTIAKASRDVIGFNWVNFTNQKSGFEEMNWKILEQNDGIKLQIIYGGNVNLPLILDGVIIGQKKVTQYQESTFNASIKLLVFFIIVILLSVIIVCVLELATLLKLQTINEKHAIIINKKRAITILPPLILLTFGLIVALHYLNHYILTPPKPPFGF